MKDHQFPETGFGGPFFHSNADVSYASQKFFKIYRDNSFYFLVNIVKSHL